MKSVQINENRYWELKYGFNLIIASFTILVAISSFVGYSTYGDLKKEVDQEIRNVMNERFGNELKSMEKNILDRKIELIALDTKENNLKKELINLEDFRNKMSDQIKQSIYLVQNLKGGNGSSTFYFDKMKTLDGDNLPEFVKAPFVVVQSKSSNIIPMMGVEITNKYIQIFNTGSEEYFDILIIKQK
jgi:hypothetical protein